MKRKRNLPCDSSCLVCHNPEACNHHVKSYKSGGATQPFNLMPLCFIHHSEIHNSGLIKFMNKKGHEAVKPWLIKNGWEFDEFLQKWTNEKNNF